MTSPCTCQIDCPAFECQCRAMHEFCKMECPCEGLFCGNRAPPGVDDSAPNEPTQDEFIALLNTRPHPAPILFKVSVGQLAPEFVADAMVHGNSTPVSLKDYRGQYVVLLFYPSNFSAESIVAFSDRHAEFKMLNVVVLAALTDAALKYSHLEWITKAQKQGGYIDIPILADTAHKISREYGVLKEDERIEHHALFIIDPKGIIRQITVTDFSVGYSVDELLRILKILQFADNYGEDKFEKVRTSRRG